MAGHSKWSQIKRKKAITDTARSKVFAKFANVIALESKKVAGKTDSPTLRAVIERARAANMPKENIERAVAKGLGAGATDMESIVYEMYGPGGVAILMDILTDSRNRSAQEIKHLVSELGYELATPGSAAWAFEKTIDGFIPKTMTPITGEDGERLNDLIERLEERDDVQSVYTNAE
jgi:YebC/PmpR family DNA-binding regulatory protein